MEGCTMILYPPRQFDANEWFVVVSFLVSWGAVLFLKGRPSLPRVVPLIIFNIFTAMSADFIIGIPPIDLYDVGDMPKYEIIEVVIYAFAYPPMVYFLVYLYERWKPEGWRFVGFVLLFSVVTAGLEGLSVLFHVFTYKGWALIYSPLVYIVVYVLDLLVYRATMHYLHKETSR
jgi:hypothetical protein